VLAFDRCAVLAGFGLPWPLLAGRWLALAAVYSWKLPQIAKVTTETPMSNMTNDGTLAGGPDNAPKSQAVPLAHSISVTCSMTGLGRTTLYRLIGSGDLTTVMVGRRRLVLATGIADLMKKGAR
jgi:excisionase family DNA binding protein